MAEQDAKAQGKQKKKNLKNKRHKTNFLQSKRSKENE
jgi:hypothetical protein